MKTKTINLYSFEELNEDQQQKAIEKLWDLNTTHEWWEYTYEDAENIGLKLTGFDLDRGSYCSGDFIGSDEECANLILENHGDKCETYKTAKAFLDEFNKLDEDTQEDERQDLADKFLKSILEDYRIMLSKEYDYLTSKEAIIESIKANEYTFNEKGELES